VHEEIGLTFASCLRSFLRQDPDILLVGEIRDYETAEIAIKSALTGHLVLSTLHTNDAPSTITRLLNMGVEPFLVTASLNAIVAQRLVRVVCYDCKQETEVAPQVLMDLGVPPRKFPIT
jgi:type IV pilus assembly protein PilB